MRPAHAIAAIITICLATTASAQTPAPAKAEFMGGSGNSPLSQIVRVGETIYLSGMLGTVPGSGLAPGGIGPETKQTMENIKTALARVNATMDDIVKCTVYLVDFKEWGAMNEQYTPYFTKHKPARSAVAVVGLARDARVEIECLAIRGAGA
jgi:2-iminobutanoate/2-iminopropanoate deaminase